MKYDQHFIFFRLHKTWNQHSANTYDDRKKIWNENFPVYSIMWEHLKLCKRVVVKSNISWGGAISRRGILFFCFCSFWLYCIAVCLLFPLFNLLHNIIGEIYNTVLTVYSHEDDRPLPQSDEVLLCTPHTTLDMVNTCLNRNPNFK